MRVLGPLHIVVNGEVVEISGRRQRVIVSMLALSPNAVVSVDQLIDAVWDTAPPPTARTQIQICVSALRRLFRDANCPWRLRTHPHGYLLEISDECVDHQRFRRRVELARAREQAGDLDGAVAELRAALTLWRGSALGGVRSDFVRRTAVRLDDSRTHANVDRVRLELELGRHAEVCADLRLLVEEHPLHEELHGYLMLALYRCGRQAEALEAFRRARTMLVERVGVEPSSRLCTIERAILNQDKTLDVPSSTVRTVEQLDTVRDEAPLVPGQLPSGVADFTGRESYLAEITQWLTGTAVADRGRGVQPMRVVAISGRGGVGKSSLAIRAAHALAADYPDGHLYADLRDVAPGDSAGVLGGFLRALGVAGGAIPDDPAERTAAFRTRLVGKRMLVVLDDAVDERQVLPLLPGSPTCAVIVTSRTKLSALPGAHRVHLDELDDEQSTELLSRIVGEDRVRAEREAALELSRLCAGLPLALRIAGARLVAKPHWSVRKLVGRLADETGRLDELSHGHLELRSNIALTYRNLSEAARRLFRLVPLVEAHEFPGWVAAALLDTDADGAEDVLEALVDEHVLDVIEYPSHRLVRYRMHDLIRIYARERLLETESTEERDRTVGRVLGAWLARADRAHREEYGGDCAVVHSGAERWRPPGAESVSDTGSAAWWEGDRAALTATVRQAASVGADDACWDLALTSVTLYEARGYFDDWLKTSTIALDAVERAGNRRGRAAMKYSLGTLHLVQKRFDEAEACLGEALALFGECGDSHGVALVLSNAAQLDWARGRTSAMLEKYSRALRTFRRVGDRMSEASVLCGLAEYRLSVRDESGVRELLDDAYALSERARCPRGQAQALYHYAELHLGRGDLLRAGSALNRTLHLVREAGDRIGEVRALYGLGTVRTRQHRLVQAEALFENALSLARLVGEEQLEAQIRYGLAEVAFAKRDVVAATRHCAAARELFRRTDAPAWQTRSRRLLHELSTLGAAPAAARSLGTATDRAAESR